MGTFQGIYYLGADLIKPYCTQLTEYKIGIYESWGEEDLPQKPRIKLKDVFMMFITCNILYDSL